LFPPAFTLAINGFRFRQVAALHLGRKGLDGLPHRCCHHYQWSA
jgi:hypothetical protein